MIERFTTGVYSVPPYSQLTVFSFRTFQKKEDQENFAHFRTRSVFCCFKKRMYGSVYDVDINVCHIETYLCHAHMFHPNIAKKCDATERKL